MRVLIIGCGGQGVLADAKGSGNEHKVISFAHAFKERGADLCFIDRNIDKSRKAAEEWGGSYHIGDEDPSFDIVTITTPDAEHHDVLKLAIRGHHKAKLIICEKPLCETVEQAKEIVKLYEEAGIPILVNYTRNFLPLYETMKGMEVEFAECYFNRGLLHSGSHAIALFEYLGIRNYKITEVKCEDRVWNLYIKFNDTHDFTETRIGNMPVPCYMNYQTRHVVENAYNFLEGKEELKCTMHDGLKALEILEKL